MENDNEKKNVTEGGDPSDGSNVTFQKIPAEPGQEDAAGGADVSAENGPTGPVTGALGDDLPPEYAAALAKDVPEVPTVTQKDLERQVRAGLNKRVVSAVVFVGAILITAILTFYLTSIYYDRLAPSKGKDSGLYSSVREGQAGMNDLGILAYLLDQYSYYAYDFDKAGIMEALMKAYVASTGDRYAAFYTEEEYGSVQQTNAGAQEGVGITSLQEPLLLNGVTVGALRIVDFMEGSPALAAGLRPDDRIIGVKSGNEWLTLMDPTPLKNQYDAFAAALLAASEESADWQTTVRVEDGRIFVRTGDSDTWQSFAFNDNNEATIHNNACLAAIRGEAGTDVTLRVMRGDEIFEITVTRGKSTSHSVLYRMSDTEPTVGIVTILKFDQTTPGQFKNAMNKLIDAGADRFVIDLRDNPGGQVYSVSTILTYFLNRKDLILTKVDRDGKVIDKNGTILAEEDPSGIYTLTREEIGMYREYPLALVVNGNTASSAEIMTSVLRDYGLATIVGEKTYGKGIMQTTESTLLNRYGISGAVTFTFCSFLPPSGVAFHGVGISPSEGYEVALSDEAAAIHSYVRPETIDNQLLAAIEAVLKK